MTLSKTSHHQWVPHTDGKVKCKSCGLEVDNPTPGNPLQMAGCAGGKVLQLVSSHEESETTPRSLLKDALKALQLKEHGFSGNKILVISVSDHDGEYKISVKSCNISPSDGIAALSVVKSEYVDLLRGIS